jgi:hypothetical protein
MEGHMETILENQASRKFAPWGETVAGLLPVIILSTATTLEGTSFQSWLMYTFLLLLIALPAIGIYVAWKHGFKRWSAAYLGLAVLDILLVLPIFIAQVVESVWWIPIIQVALILLLLFLFYRRVMDQRGKPTRMKPLAEFDWTQILFCAQTLTPLLVMILFDEIAIAYKTPYLLLSGFILALGGLVYIRSHLLWTGVAALLGSILLTLFMANTVAGTYWNAYPGG